MSEEPVQASPDISAQGKEISSALEHVLKTVVETLTSHSQKADGGTRLWFPNGIELIDVEVKAGPVDVRVKVAGPKAASNAE